MEVERLASPEEFLERAGTYLLTSEARHNLILGISDTLVRRPGAYPESQHWLVTHADAVTMAALRTPPFDLVLSDGDETSVATLVDALAEDAGAFPGVVGNRPTVDAFAERWRGATGRAAFVRMRQGVFEATEVAGVPTAGGEWLRAGPGDRPLVAEWLRAFEIETFPDRSDAERAASRERSETMLDVRLAEEADTGLWLYRVGGVPVSLAGCGGSTPNGVRVGPVYTPSEHRCHGYATELVAAMTRHLLAGDRRFCFLYTDLSNPTSNAIYERIGYRMVCESTEYAFSD